MPTRDWYAEGFRYEELATCLPGSLFTISYVENEEVEEVREIHVGAELIDINGNLFPRYYKTWVKHPIPS